MMMTLNFSQRLLEGATYGGDGTLNTLSPFSPSRDQE